MWHRDVVAIRPANAADRAWIERTLVERWGSTVIVGRDRICDAASLDALVAVDTAGGAGEAPAERDEPPERIGLLTYRVEDGALEVVTIDSLRPRSGVGGGAA